MRFLFFLIIIFISACSNNKCDIYSHSKVDFTININNYIDSIKNINSRNEFIKFIDDHSSILYPFFDVNENKISERKSYIGSIYSN